MKLVKENPSFESEVKDKIGFMDEVREGIASKTNYLVATLKVNMEFNQGKPKGDELAVCIEKLKDIDIKEVEIKQAQKKEKELEEKRDYNECRHYLALLGVSYLNGDKKTLRKHLAMLDKDINILYDEYSKTKDIRSKQLLGEMISVYNKINAHLISMKQVENTRSEKNI